MVGEFIEVGYQLHNVLMEGQRYVVMKEEAALLPRLSSTGNALFSCQKAVNAIH